MAKRRIYAAIVTIAIASAAILISFPLKAQSRVPQIDIQYSDESTQVNKCVLSQRTKEQEIMVNLKRVDRIEATATRAFLYSGNLRAVIDIENRAQIAGIRRAYQECVDR